MQKNLTDPKTLTQVAIGLGVLFVTVWIVGKAWKRSQSFSGAAGRRKPAIRGRHACKCVDGEFSYVCCGSTLHTR